MSLMTPVPPQVARLSEPFPYIVCVQLKNDLKQYSLFFDELRRSIHWMNELPNVWIITRYETMIELSHILTTKIYNGDRLLILPVVGPATGVMPETAWKWINSVVPRLW
jgi:hypothetical protein